MAKVKTSGISGYGLKSPLSKDNSGKKIQSSGGMGDYYGSGVRNPMAKSRDVGLNPVTPAKLKKPPKSLA